MLTIRIIILFSTLLIATLGSAYTMVYGSETRHTLLPSDQGLYPWRATFSSDQEFGGKSVIDVRDSIYNISFDFIVIPALQYPYVAYNLIFEDDADPGNVEDWSSYSFLELRVKCSPDNILHLVLFTHDDRVTQSSTDINMFRLSRTTFSCGEAWRTARFDLNRMVVADWWLERHDLNIADRDYSLDKVRALAITTSVESPVDTPSNFIIQELALVGRNWSLIYALSALVLIAWGTFIGWLAYQFYVTREKSPVVHEIAPLAYLPTNLESRQEREKEAVLNYMASQYVNPQLSVDVAVRELGMNRIKINEILRAETGLTFSTYLNKLRLAEAARLLSDKHLGVAEAAFAVGYNSLSYFNRVFKKEYGCNPSTYKGTSAEALTP